MTQKKQKPVIPKPRKEVPCPASPDPDEAGRNYARAITSPEVAAYRVTMSCEQPDLTAQIDVPGMLRMFKDQGEAFSESWRLERAQGDNQPWLVAGIRQNG